MKHRSDGQLTPGGFHWLENEHIAATSNIHCLSELYPLSKWCNASIVSYITIICELLKSHKWGFPETGPLNGWFTGWKIPSRNG